MGVVITDSFITVKCGAELTGYTGSFIRRLASNGRIRAQKFGRDWQISRASLLDYRQRMQSLGVAKHIPRQYREDDTEVEAEANPTPEAV